MHYTFFLGDGYLTRLLYFQAGKDAHYTRFILSFSSPGNNNYNIYAVTTLSRCENWGISATSALPISREDVAAGEGALQT